MAERLVAALEAGQAAGGDKRGQQSAAVVVERRGWGKESGSGVDRLVDLRVDDHKEPIRELRRLLEIQIAGEATARAMRHYEKKEWAEGARLLREALRRTPDAADVLYNLACFESLGGRRAEALEHLRRAVERDEKLRALARDDPDFTPLRDDAEWKKIVGAGGNQGRGP